MIRRGLQPYVIAVAMVVSVVMVYKISRTYSYNNLELFTKNNNEKIAQPNDVVNVAQVDNNDRGTLQNQPSAKVNTGGYEAHVNVQNVHEKVNADFPCVPLKATARNTPMCVYSSKEDSIISKQFNQGKVYELHNIKPYIQLLNADPEVGVIDLGANLGLYSLVALSLGHPIIAVEPNLQTNMRLHKSINLGGYAKNATLLYNAVSDHRGRTAIKVKSQHNKGDTRITCNEVPAELIKCDTADCDLVDVITMDDMLSYVTFKKAIMKIDIQGCEHRVINTAQNFLDKIDVTHILMEWVLMKDHYVSARHTSHDKTLVVETIAMLRKRGYEPRQIRQTGGLQDEKWYQWPYDVLWTKV